LDLKNAKICIPTVVADFEGARRYELPFDGVRQKEQHHARVHLHGKKFEIIEKNIIFKTFFKKYPTLFSSAHVYAFGVFQPIMANGF
jgi:hypothetical protein